MNNNGFYLSLVNTFPELDSIRNPFFAALEMLLDCVKNGGKIMICGNGGSAADAEHIVGELMKSFLIPRPLPAAHKAALSDCCSQYGVELGTMLQQAIPAIALTSGLSLSTAFANDVSSDLCFAQQVYGLSKPCDIVWGISTSGNSKNVNHALRVARAMGLKTLGFSGRDGGAMAALCDVEIRVPLSCTPQIQERHLPIYHALCASLEATLFSEE